MHEKFQRKYPYYGDNQKLKNEAQKNLKKIVCKATIFNIYFFSLKFWMF